MSNVVPIRKVPVLTLFAPEEDRKPLGIVAARSDACMDMPDAIDMLESLLIERATEKFPEARLICNFNFTQCHEDGRLWWYEATADVYGDLACS